MCCNNYASVPHWALNACICVSKFRLVHCASLADVVASPTTTSLPERPQTANFCCLGQLGMVGPESLHLGRTVYLQAMSGLTPVTQAHGGTVSLQEGVFQQGLFHFNLFNCRRHVQPDTAWNQLVSKNISVQEFSTSVAFQSKQRGTTCTTCRSFRSNQLLASLAVPPGFS